MSHACADCVRCATCRREWCPTIADHDSAHPACTEVLQPPHFIAEGKGDQ